MSQPAGHRLFARYAHAPNARGYCGPAGASGLEAVACGHGEDVDVTALARRFSGAWPYQALLAELAGIEDPLDERVGRAYWTGSPLTGAVDAGTLGELLLERFGRQAGHYWSHLTEELLEEVAPTHAFHVLGVYPWSRLLAGGRPEPLRVLDSCRVRPAEVLELRGPRLLVRARALGYAHGALRLGPPADEEVSWALGQGTFTGPLEPGDHVALHWQHACDALGPEDAAQLEAWTDRQLEATNRRLARSAA